MNQCNAISFTLAFSELLTFWGSSLRVTVSLLTLPHVIYPNSACGKSAYIVNFTPSSILKMFSSSTSNGYMKSALNIQVRLRF